LIGRDIRIRLRVGGGRADRRAVFSSPSPVLMPFALGPDLALLTRLRALDSLARRAVASLLTLDRLFTADHDDGSLDLIRDGPTPLELACAAKRWRTGSPAGLAADHRHPVLGPDAQLSTSPRPQPVALTLLVGTPALTFTGMIGAALAVTMHRGGLLLACWCCRCRSRS
jgi:heme exporter protein B